MRLADIAARGAARKPRHVAIVDAVTGRRVTYRALGERVDRLARGLARHAAPGDRVAVLALNRVEYLEIYLAAAFAGLVAQGLNWRLATDELERIVRDGEPSVFVYDDEFADVASELQARVDVPTWLGFGPGSDGSYEDCVASGTDIKGDLPEAVADDPVLVIYTGGTTGESKGAVHTNGSCVAAMVNNTVAERVLPSDRYMLLGQMFHSASVLALNYLTHGATVVLMPRFDPRLSLEVIESESVTASLAFPAMINYMLAEAGGSRFDLSSLRNVQYGGGPMAPNVILSMMDALPCSLIQCYGSSEHVGVAFLSQEDHRAAAARNDVRLLSSCGREAYLSRVRVVDEVGAPVPRDGKTPGEIVVASPANMAGYWRRPDLTERVRRGRWLGTGDLAAWDEQGYLYIVGRAKEVIISGGENIYPAQVENAIADHPAVLEAAIVGTPDELWGEVVTAFVVPKAGFELSADDVQGVVTARLGSYQKPRLVHFLSELPKASSGKVAKSELASTLSQHTESEPRRSS